MILAGGKIHGPARLAYAAVNLGPCVLTQLSSAAITAVTATIVTKDMSATTQPPPLDCGLLHNAWRPTSLQAGPFFVEPSGGGGIRTHEHLLRR